MISQALGIAEFIAADVVCWLSIFGCSTVVTSSPGDEEKFYGCLGYCTLIQGILITIGSIALIFLWNLNFLTYAPMVASVFLITVIMGKYVCGIPSETAEGKPTTTDKANRVIFWFDVDSLDELPLPVDEVCNIILKKYGIVEKLNTGARLAHFYKRDSDLISQMQREDNEQIAYLAVAMAKRVGMSDEDFEKFGHLRTFQIGSIWRFVAY